jgi:hypothetical protein
MPNTSKYNSKMLKIDSPASPAPRTGVIGTVHPYWVERRRARLQARKAQGRVGPQGLKHCQEKNLKKVIDLNS